MIKEKNINLFLDSGAFSAKTQGVEINIDEYIAFIKEHEDVINVYANLDVIGSAADTWKNQILMEKAGLKPLPCFHYGEDIKWLERYLKKGYDYIALGGMVKTPNLTAWLDNLFVNYLTDDEGMPKIKVHGFGMTSLSIMLRYPWYSVDSTSWVVTGRLGSIYVPRLVGKRFVYDESSLKVAVSSKSPSNKESGKHITTMSPQLKKNILTYIEYKGYVLGSSTFRMKSQDYQLKENEKWSSKKPKNKIDKREVETIVERGICNDYKLRDEMNIIYFLDLEKSIPKWPHKLKIKNNLKRFL